MDKKRIINRTITDTPRQASERLRIHTYDRVMREVIAARAAHKAVDHVFRIYHRIDQNEIDELFDDLFGVITKTLENWKVDN